MWTMQVLCPDEHGRMKWQDVQPSHTKEPYHYEAAEQALRMLEICYPDQCREIRLDGPEHARVRVSNSENLEVRYPAWHSLSNRREAS